MMSLRHSEKGSAGAEFALAVPVLALFLIGIFQLSILFAANAGLRQAVGAGARVATLYPHPDDTAIIAQIRRAGFALNSAYLDAPTLTHGTANGVAYVDIDLTYRPPLNFAFFQGPRITMTRSRRAYLN